MKYLFLENTTELNRKNGNYTHYFSYYITNDDKFELDDFKKMQSKEEINFKLDHYEPGLNIPFKSSRSYCPKHLEELLKNAFKYILNNGFDIIDEPNFKPFLRLTVDDENNVIEAE